MINILKIKAKVIKIHQYLKMIRLYLGNIIHTLRASGELKIYLIMKINFILSKDCSES